MRYICTREVEAYHFRGDNPHDFPEAMRPRLYVSAIRKTVDGYYYVTNTTPAGNAFIHEYDDTDVLPFSFFDGKTIEVPIAPSTQHLVDQYLARYDAHLSPPVLILDGLRHGVSVPANCWLTISIPDLRVQVYSDAVFRMYHKREYVDNDLPGKVWSCKIGFNKEEVSDSELRNSLLRTYLRLTGRDPTFMLSGWGAKLSSEERKALK